MENLDTIVLRGLTQSRDGRTGVGMIERVSPVPPFGEQLATATPKTLDTLNDRIGHAGNDKSPGWRMSRGALAARTRLDSTTAMASHHPGAATAPDPHLVPPVLAVWLSVVRPCFTAPVWDRILVLVAGAVLAPGKRTVDPGAARHGTRRCAELSPLS
jgi:hypothetical protein